MTEFLKLINKRRSIYNLNNKTSLMQDEITHIIEQCMWEAPSAFNSQTPKVVVLYSDHYHRFWYIVLETLRKMVPAENFKAIEDKVNSFMMGIGTILFYEDDSITQGLQEKFPAYKDKFPQWAEHNNAILQYMVWTALSEQGIGSSIQHYNPIIDDETGQVFDIPKNWRLIAQMPFGGISKAADIKTHIELEERLKIFK